MREKVKLFVGIIISIMLFSCSDRAEKIGGKSTFTLDLNEKATSDNSDKIHQLLDSLNATAARADYNKYFSYFTTTATYNGTDATENWDKNSFMDWAKPYFDAKTTWNFKSIKRNIYFGENDNIAWFDELLSTQMKICRGSGVVVKQHNEWKIQQYVLSMTIPNSKLDEIVKIKTAEEDEIVNQLKK